MFPTAVSSVGYTFQRNIFFKNVESISTISRKDIWKIIRGGQVTNRFFRGNRDGRWDQIWGISGSLMRGGGLSSMVMGGRCIAGIPQSAVK